VNSSVTDCAGCLDGGSDSVTLLFSLPVESLKTLPSVGHIGIDVNISRNLIVCAYTAATSVRPFGGLGKAATQVIFDAAPATCTLGEECKIYLQGSALVSRLKFVPFPNGEPVTSAEFTTSCGSITGEDWGEAELGANGAGWAAYDCHASGCTFGNLWIPRATSGIYALCSSNPGVLSGTGVVIVGMFQMIGPLEGQARLAERGQPLELDITGLWDEDLHKTRADDRTGELPHSRRFS